MFTCVSLKGVDEAEVGCDVFDGELRQPHTAVESVCAPATSSARGLGLGLASSLHGCVWHRRSPPSARSLPRVCTCVSVLRTIHHLLMPQTIGLRPFDLEELAASVDFVLPRNRQRPPRSSMMSLGYHQY